MGFGVEVTDRRWPRLQSLWEPEAQAHQVKGKAYRDVTEAGVSLCGPYMSDALHVSAPGPTFPGKEQSKVQHSGMTTPPVPDETDTQSWEGPCGH